jgi:phosphatidylserine/phosphatidylglycerophosphate/cardiolipin synthase-like enzyme
MPVSIDLVMFYLSDRHVIEALKEAAANGTMIRLILDPNKDAFGHEKGGVPNRQVAEELSQVDNISIRWADTHGEQCHSKMLLVRTGDGRAGLMLGSANFTRRNLDDYNLELNALVRGPGTAEPFQRASDYFDDLWENRGDRVFTTGFETYRDTSSLRYWRYRVMEAMGISTF